MSVIKQAKKTITGGFKVGGAHMANPNATVHNGSRWGGFYPNKYKN